MKIAVTAYRVDRLPGWVAHEAKLDRLVRDAAADLVILPEYAALEAALIAAPATLPVADWIALAAERAPQWIDQARHIAGLHGCHILAGSGPWSTDRGNVNRAWLVSPAGEVVFQDKLILTPYERDVMGMVPGQELKVFDTALGRIGIEICYDSEFPLFARAQAEAGAEMILVPSNTELPAGQTRVRQSCRARAIENQILVVHSPMVGRVEGCEIIEETTGRAGAFGPPDHGLPPDGIIAQGETGVHGAVVFDADPAAISAPRRHGAVGNFAHWPEQARIAAVTTEALR